MDYKIKVVNLNTKAHTEIAIDNTKSLMLVYFSVYDELGFNDFKDMNRFFKVGSKYYVRSDIDLFDVGLTQEGQILEIGFTEGEK